MEPSFDLPDSTDWLTSSLPIVAPLESALRCQICKDFFDNPVITSCSHTFCSLCIRRCLSAEGKCPTCRSSDQESKLRRNWAVQEIVEGFQTARPDVLTLARRAQRGQTADTTLEEDGNGKAGDLPQPATKKRRLNQSETEVEQDALPAQPEARRTRSHGRQVENQPAPTFSDGVDDIRDGHYVPDDGLVPCPLCHLRMKEQAVFNHLDNCKGPMEETSQSHTPVLRQRPQQPFHSLRTRNIKPNFHKPPERLPTLNYSLLKESVLRKKLKDLGIPDWGPRNLLQRRHTEWMNLWNANCDAKIPKTKEELRRDLDVWERSQGGAAPQKYSAGPNAVMSKTFDATAWSVNHDNDFKWLIENARKQKRNSKKNKIEQDNSLTTNQSHQDGDITSSAMSDAYSRHREAHSVLTEKKSSPSPTAPTQSCSLPATAHTLAGGYSVIPNRDATTCVQDGDNGSYPMPQNEYM